MDKKFDLKEYFKEGKYVYWLFGVVISDVILFVLKDEDFFKNSIVSVCGVEIKNAYIIMLVLIFIFLIWFFLSYFVEANRLIEKEHEKNKEIYKNSEELFSKYNCLISELNNIEKIRESNKLYNVAMTLDTFEPAKFKLLDELAEKYHHVHAAMIIANFYHSGLFNGSVEVIKKDYEKAYYYYNLVEEYDPTGIVAWRMGWMHEKNQIDRHLSQNEQDEIARRYYEISKDKNFVKAYNSIGKFYNMGRGGLKENLNEAIYHYRTATIMGDTFSVLNEAYIHAKNPASFDLAIECFNIAIGYRTPIAFLKFGEFIEENIDLLSSSKYELTLEKAFDLYCTATTFNKGPVSARAYYKLGKLIDKCSDITLNKEEFLNNIFESRSSNWVNDAYKKAIEIFEYNRKNNVVFTTADTRIYNELLRMKSEKELQNV